MIAVDTNILVYAHRKDSEFHKQANAKVRELAEGSVSWEISWPCIHEFYSIVSHPKIFKPPTSSNKAPTQIDSWLELPTTHLLMETQNYWKTLRRTIVTSKIISPQIHDARISAIFLEHGVDCLWSTDRFFCRFSELKVENPLL